MSSTILSLLNDLRHYTVEEEVLNIYTNGGDLRYNQKGLFKYLCLNIYYNPRLIANILSLKLVDGMNRYYIAINTKEDLNIFLVNGEQKLKFRHNK